MSTKDDILGAGASSEAKKVSTAETSPMQPATLTGGYRVEFTGPQPDKGSVAPETASDAGELRLPPQRFSYTEMFRQANPDPRLTPEEEAKLARKKKREQVFAAISDGISALANLYFTTKGAPNMYDGSNSLSRQTSERYAKLAADRNAKMKAYIDGLARARQADDAYNQKEREWARLIGLDKVKQARDAAADARAAAKEARDAEMHDLDLKLRGNQITKSEYDAQAARVAAEYAPKIQQGKVDHLSAQTRASQASANASNARARSYGNGGGGRSSAASGGAGKGKADAQPFPPFRIRDNHGRTVKKYDLNDLKQVPYAYNDAKKVGIINDSGEAPKTVKEMRERLLMSLGQDPVVTSTKLNGDLRSDDSFSIADYKRGGNRKNSRSSDAPPLN